MAASLCGKYLPRSARLSVIDAGFGGAQPKKGVEQAPQVMFQAGLQKVAGDSGTIDVQGPEAVDFGSLRPAEDMPYRGMNNPRWVSAATRSISDQVYREAMMQNQVLTLGGDHSIAIGTLTGTAKAVRARFGTTQKLGIIYVDAHADLNVPEDSQSGNIHGMAVAFASGVATSSKTGVFDWIIADRLISLDKFVYIGLRDVDEAEKRTILAQKIKAFWMSDVQNLGIHDVMRNSLEYLGDVPIHVSFDIDALDPTVAPCTGLPVSDGLSLAEATYIMNAVRLSGRLIAMDLVEINPRLGNSAEVQRTIASAFDVVRAGLAAT